VRRAHFALAAVVIGLGVLLALTREESAESVFSPTIEDPPRGYVCYRASSSPTIDGSLDDAAWADAPWSEPFRDIEGDKQPEPPLRTRMKMLWDDKGLYIAAELEEPHIWATLREHDAVIFHDNDFEVFLDPDADSHMYGEFEMNAFNTTWDLLLGKPYRDGGPAINGWEIVGLQSAVRIDGTINDPSDRDRGWTLEIAWPWKGLGELSTIKDSVPPKDGTQWRINFSRVEWDMKISDGKYEKIPKRPEHNWVWSPQGAIDMHRPEKWGVLQFSTAVPGTVAYIGDPAQGTRDYLYRVYHAQAKYHKSHGRYTNRLADLSESTLPRGLTSAKMETTERTFAASVERQSGEKRERWRISSDGRLRKD
jgi:hypothetical protein